MYYATGPVIFILPESSSFWNFTISLSANIVQFSLYKIFNSSVIFHSVFTVLARNSFAIRSWRFSCTPKLKTMDFPSRPSIVLESPLATSFWEPKKVFPQFEWRRNVVEDVMGPKIIQSWLLNCFQCVTNYKRFRNSVSGLFYWNWPFPSRVRKRIAPQKM